MMNLLGDPNDTLVVRALNIRRMTMVYDVDIGTPVTPVTARLTSVTVHVPDPGLLEEAAGEITQWVRRKTGGELVPVEIVRWVPPVVPGSVACRFCGKTLTQTGDGYWADEEGFATCTDGRALHNPPEGVPGG